MGHRLAVSEGAILTASAGAPEPFAVAAPEAKVWERFVATYQRYGRARLSLHTRIFNEDTETPAVEFDGQYVLHR